MYLKRINNTYKNSNSHMNCPKFYKFKYIIYQFPYKPIFQLMRTMENPVFKALIVLFVWQIALAQNNYTLLDGSGLSSPTLIFKSAVINIENYLLFATAKSIANGSAYLATYSLISGSPIFMHTSSDTNNASPITYERIEIAGAYLMVQNSLNQVLIFNSSDGLFLFTSVIQSFYKGRHIVGKNLYVYSTNANITLNIANSIRYINLSNINATTIIIEGIGSNPYLFVSQNEQILGFVTSASTAITFFSTTTWTLFLTYVLTFVPQSACFAISDSQIYASGSQYLFQGNFLSSTINQVYQSNYLQIINTDMIYSPELNELFLMVNGQLTIYSTITTLAIDPLSIGYFPIGNTLAMQSFSQHNFIIFQGTDFGNLLIYKRAITQLNCLGATYANLTLAFCLPCSANCINCSSSTVCNICNDITFLKTDICCNLNQYSNGGVCANCAPYCLACDNLSNCIKCDTPLSTDYKGICCLTQTQYYNSVSGSCESCSANCLYCDSYENCIKCEADYQMSGGYCCRAAQWNNASMSCETNTTTTTTYDLQCDSYGEQAGRPICQSPSLTSFASILIKISKIVISSPYGRQALTFMSPFLFFSDDFWYYVYHNRTYTQMIFTTTFFSILAQMNTGRMLNQFIDTTSIQSLTDPSKTFTSDYSNYTFQNIMLIDQQQSYFTVNMQDLFVWSYTSITITFILMKIFIHVITNIQATGITQKILFYIGKTIYPYSCVHYMIIAMIETNAIIICFGSLRQFKQFFCFQFSDKVNLIICLSFFFGLVMYAICFYPILHRFWKRQAKKILECSRKDTFSYNYQASRQVMKCIVFSSIHSYCLEFYQTQIFLLAICRIFIITAVVRSRQFFKFKIIFVLSLMYVVMCFVFDILMILSYYALEKGGIDQNIMKYHTVFEEIVIFGMTGIVVVTVVIKFGIFLYEIKDSCIKNKVKPEMGMKTMLSIPHTALKFTKNHILEQQTPPKMKIEGLQIDNIKSLNDLQEGFNNQVFKSTTLKLKVVTSKILQVKEVRFDVQKNQYKNIFDNNPNQNQQHFQNIEQNIEDENFIELK